MKGFTGFIAYASVPPQIGPIIEAAAKNVNTRCGAGTVSTWRQNDVPGRFLTDPIWDQIRSADLIIADISVLNFNVVYEIGFCIGLGKRAFLVRNSSVQNDVELAREVGIFDTLGFVEYDTSAALEKVLLSITDKTGLPLGAKLDTSSPLYLLLPREKTDEEIRILSRIKKAKMRPRIHDPEEHGRLPSNKAIDGVCASFGVVVPFLANHRREAKVHNIRAAFVAGLAHGMQKPRLLLQSGNDPVPLDYRDFVKSFANKEQINPLIAEFVPDVYEATIGAGTLAAPKAKNTLARVSLGASAAEDEFQSLGQYYLRTEEFERIARGEVRLVVGRKGSGKTAVFGQLRESVRRHRQKTVLDLRPEGFQLLKFKELVLDRVQQGSKEHVMTAFWEYLLLLELCHKLLDKDKDRHLTDNRLFEPYRTLRSVYVEDAYVSEGDFAERMTRLLDGVAQRFTGLKDGQDDKALALDSAKITEMLYVHDIRKLREAVTKYLEFKEDVWILFDNLDKGWPAYGLTPEDVVAFRSLLDATTKLTQLLRNKNLNCYATIFVRNDVYEWLLEATSDRGKVSHVLVDWTDVELLRELLRKRISASLSGGSASDEKFESLWNQICTSHIDGEESSQYLIERSLMRPRGLIDLVQFCRSRALNLGKERMDESDIREGEANYSTELVTNIGYEIRDVFPAADGVLYGLLGKKSWLGTEEIEQVLAATTAPLHADDKERVLRLLLWYGVLGVVREDGEYAYIYTVKYDMKRLLAVAKASPSGSPIYCVNPAFWSGLEIKN